MKYEFKVGDFVTIHFKYSNAERDGKVVAITPKGVARVLVPKSPDYHRESVVYIQDDGKSRMGTFVVVKHWRSDSPAGTANGAK